MTAPEPDPVMARIGAAQALAAAGDREGAMAAFAAVWADLGEDGDALHLVSLAHYVADLQDDPRAELEWDQRAMRAFERLTDERAKRHHDALSVRGFLPSLHLNLAADHARLGHREAALHHLAAAEEALPALADDGYGLMIRGGVERLRADLGASRIT